MNETLVQELRRELERQIHMRYLAEQELDIVKNENKMLKEKINQYENEPKILVKRKEQK